MPQNPETMACQKLERFIHGAFLSEKLMPNLPPSIQEADEALSEITNTEEKIDIFHAHLNEWIESETKSISHRWQELADKQTPLAWETIDDEWLENARAEADKTTGFSFERTLYKVGYLLNRIHKTVNDKVTPKNITQRHQRGFSTYNESLPWEDEITIPSRIAGPKNLDISLFDILLTVVAFYGGELPDYEVIRNGKNRNLQMLRMQEFYDFEPTSNGHEIPGFQSELMFDTGSIFGYHGANKGTAHVHLKFRILWETLRKLTRKKDGTTQFGIFPMECNEHVYFRDEWSKLAFKHKLHEAEPALQKIATLMSEYREDEYT